MKKFLLAAAKWAAVCAFWLLMWQLASMFLDSAVLLPGPAATLNRLWAMCGEAELWTAVAFSLLRILLGFVCGMVLGCGLGAVTAASPLLRELFRPLMTIIKSTPVASFIILLLVLIPTGTVPSFTVLLMVVPVFWTNIYTGATQTDRSLLEMAQVFLLSRSAKLRHIYIPSVMPYFTGALTSGIGLAWKAGIAAEVICVTRDSIGKGLFQSKIYMETEDLFAWTAVVIVLSLILENVLVALINYATRRKNLTGHGFAGESAKSSADESRKPETPVSAEQTAEPVGITMSNISKSFDGRKVLDNFSLSVGDGERVSLRGVSGCGKTTVLRLLAGLEQPDSGIVDIDGAPRISMIFQENRLLPWRSALSNITVAGADESTALFYLERLGLGGEEHKLPGELSGGMRRRVAIARALANPGELFLLDEPIQGLDDGTAGMVLKVMDKELEGRTAVLVSHDDEEIGMLARRVIEMPGLSV